jgi:hypothetical protein
VPSSRRQETAERFAPRLDAVSPRDSQAPVSLRTEEGELFTIHVGAALDPAWAEWFEGMVIVRLPDGTSSITGIVRDQAALFGMLLRVRDLGLPLRGLYPGPEVQESRGRC